MSNENQTKLIIFDVGGVLIQNFCIAGKFALSYGLDPDEFLDEYKHYEFPLMDGTIPASAFYDHLEKVFGTRVSGNPFADLFTPTLDGAIVDLISKIRSIRPDWGIVCGTNTYAPHWDAICQKGWDKIFDRCYASHLMGICKPRKAFFAHILRAESVLPEEAVFVDDFQENVAAAQAIGIEAHLFASAKQLDQELFLKKPAPLAQEASQV